MQHILIYYHSLSINCTFGLYRNNTIISTIYKTIPANNKLVSFRVQFFFPQKSVFRNESQSVALLVVQTGTYLNHLQHFVEQQSHHHLPVSKMFNLFKLGKLLVVNSRCHYLSLEIFVNETLCSLKHLFIFMLLQFFDFVETLKKQGRRRTLKNLICIENNHKIV